MTFVGRLSALEKAQSIPEQAADHIKLDPLDERRRWLQESPHWAVMASTMDHQSLMFI
jgi:hypothetical protein